MSFEVRMVPPHWDHLKERDPYRNEMRYVPMHDTTFEQAAKEWKEGYAAWERGERPDYMKGDDRYRDYEFWEYSGNPPTRDDRRPWKDEEATWYQLWESVSEGTPVSPPFATEEELILYLAQEGDFWDHKPWGLDRARALVKAGSSLGSMMIDNGVLVEARDMPLYFEEQKKA